MTLSTAKSLHTFSGLFHTGGKLHYVREPEVAFDTVLVDQAVHWLALDNMCSQLTEQEETWSLRQFMFRCHGYMLRPRLRPGWMPSWRLAGEYANPFHFEDSKALPKYRSDVVRGAIDAKRISDGKLVHIKCIKSKSAEHQIAKMLLGDDATNTMPVIDVFESEDNHKDAFIVTPFLRSADSPPFESVDDILDCGEQLLENLVALHAKGIAHRSITMRDLALDASPLYPQGFHPVQDDCLPDAVTPTSPLSRRRARVSYYIINFSTAMRMPEPYDRTKPAMLDVGRYAWHGRSATPPELVAVNMGLRTQYNPFLLDVWLLGCAFNRMFAQVRCLPLRRLATFNS
ncbi:hypothetical protein EVJ58_g8807 [Rhodofomes roseus]|uniref:Protein kinase domain-containing protein n=1 Tax=Rhodofomes roseus TaxID=34475 RepID=A0A4Y9XXN6_9APHY|nr:hypothetical protein EVJ58_g8807 [Rhodofomes roseus]